MVISSIIRPRIAEECPQNVRKCRGSAEDADRSWRGVRRSGYQPALCTADELLGWQRYLWLLYPLSLDGFDRLGYDSAMIKSFKDKETEKVFNGQLSRRLPRDVQRIAELS